jgi:hypothetical protein
MPAVKSSRKKRVPVQGKAWIWIIVPLCLVLVSGYLLFRNCGPFPNIPETTEQAVPPEGAEAEVPDLHEGSRLEESEAASREQYKLFFGNEDFNSSLADCDDLFPVFRDGKGVEDIISKALSELIKGPTDEEKGQGYYTSLRPGIRILGIRNESGTIYADFSRELEEGVAGSCQTMAIRAQINETLLQFAGVRDVVILVEGSPGNVLQP